MKSSPIILQWRAGRADRWQTFHISGVPVIRPVKIRIDAVRDSLTAEAKKLAAAILEIVKSVEGQWEDAGLQNLVELASGGECLLETVMCDGENAFLGELDPRIVEALKESRSSHSHVWVMPVMPSGGKPEKMPEQLQKQNVAFWEGSAESLALTVLGRSGVTSLDRRIFLSYRRTETAPMAGQLFDALSKLNYSVFLDTVSVHRGVDFQDRLFEELGDKSMVVLLHSRKFSDSLWTMAEVRYARSHDLSMLIYRLPDVKEEDPLVKDYTPGDSVFLEETTDVIRASKDKEAPWSIVPDRLHEVVAEITRHHDREMILRLRRLQTRTREALESNSVTCQASSSGAGVRVTLPNGHWRLFPVSRPPGVPELFDASRFKEQPVEEEQPEEEQRAVIGNVASFHPVRRSQLDWVVVGRNVTYLDIHNLDPWLKAQHAVTEKSMRFQWQRTKGPGQLNGAFIFISASVPDAGRDPRFLMGPAPQAVMLREIDRRVKDAVQSLVAQVLTAGGRIVHGGQPRVMAFIADQAGNWLPDPNSEETAPIVTYQSEWFSNSKPPPPGRFELEREGVGETRWVSTDVRQVAEKWGLGTFLFSPGAGDKPWRQPSLQRLARQAPGEALRGPLLAMRLQMLMECQPIVEVCFGGMEGIEAEAELYRDLTKEGRLPSIGGVQVISSTFGAAGSLGREDFHVFDENEWIQMKENPDVLGESPNYNTMMRSLVERLATGIGAVGIAPYSQPPRH